MERGYRWGNLRGRLPDYIRIFRHESLIPMQPLAFRLEAPCPRRQQSAAPLFSASLDRRSEDIRVLSVVITELEFGNIKRHIFAAHFVECADHAALEYRPESFDGLCMNCTNDVLAARMVNSRVRIFAVETFVATPLI